MTWLTLAGNAAWRTGQRLVSTRPPAKHRHPRNGKSAAGRSLQARLLRNLAAQKRNKLARKAALPAASAGSSSEDRPERGKPGRSPTLKSDRTVCDHLNLKNYHQFVETPVKVDIVRMLQANISITSENYNRDGCGKEPWHNPSTCWISFSGSASSDPIDAVDEAIHQPQLLFRKSSMTCAVPKAITATIVDRMMET